MTNSKQHVRVLKNNTLLIFKDPIACTFGFISFVLIVVMGYFFGDISNEIGNLWITYVVVQYTAHLLLAIIFGLFVAATIYKIRYFSHIDHSKTTLWGTWGIIGVILIGCPACSISIASYMWLGTLLTQLPWFGLEIKILWLILLGRATYTTIYHLTTCEISPNKKSLS